MERPIFARPPGKVFSFPDRTAFIAFLDAYEVPYKTWKKKYLDKSWKEICEKDAVYTTGAAWGHSERAVRWIITVSPRVVIESLGETYVLNEWTLENEEDEFYEPREYADSSVSEKMELNADGSPKESVEETIQKCLVQETKTPPVSIRQLRENLIPYPHESTDPLARLLGCRDVEIDYYERERKLQVCGI